MSNWVEFSETELESLLHREQRYEVLGNTKARLQLEMMVELARRGDKIYASESSVQLAMREKGLRFDE